MYLVVRDTETLFIMHNLFLVEVKNWYTLNNMKNLESDNKKRDGCQEIFLIFFRNSKNWIYDKSNHLMAIHLK